MTDGRFPRGKRGLKLSDLDEVMFYDGRFPRGKRGLKCAQKGNSAMTDGRFPRGKRGLKYPFSPSFPPLLPVASPAGSVD